MYMHTIDPVIVVGAGYVGLVTAVGFAAVTDVCLVDKDANRIDQLLDGKLPINEPGLDERFRNSRINLRFFNDLERALSDSSLGVNRLVFVAVGTPTVDGGAKFDDDAFGAPDLRQVEAVVQTLLQHDNVAVVMKSTVPPGTARRMHALASEAGRELTYVSCPEFLQEGQALAGFDSPDRIVIGASDHDDWAVKALVELHEAAHDANKPLDHDLTFECMDPTSAETVKYASNLHLAMRVSFANQIATFCEEAGADVQPVLNAVGADERIGSRFLQPGIGFGGSCFRKDALAFNNAGVKLGVPLTLAEATIRVNDDQIERVIRKLELGLGELDNKQVTLLGLAFKPDTDDIRDGPAFKIAGRLRDRNVRVRAWDPEPATHDHALANWDARRESRTSARRTANPGTRGAEWMASDELGIDAIDAMSGSHAVVVVTDWASFREIDWTEASEVMTGDLVIDGRNCLQPDDVIAAGLTYVGTGRLVEELVARRNSPRDRYE